MELEIKPYQGLGFLLLKENRQFFHQKLGGEILTTLPEEGNEGWPDSPLSDYFVACDVKIEYDSEEKSIFIEVGPYFEVTFYGQALFSLPYHELFKFMSTMDGDLVIEEEIGFTSEKYGLAIYGPQGAKDNITPCELISVFVEGYYD